MAKLQSLDIISDVGKKFTFKFERDITRFVQCDAGNLKFFNIVRIWSVNTMHIADYSIVRVLEFAFGGRDNAPIESSQVIFHYGNDKFQLQRSKNEFFINDEVINYIERIYYIHW